MEFTNLRVVDGGHEPSRPASDSGPSQPMVAHAALVGTPPIFRGAACRVPIAKAHRNGRRIRMASGGGTNAPAIVVARGLDATIEDELDQRAVRLRKPVAVSELPHLAVALVAGGGRREANE